jgi:hypothetical protein
MSPLGLIPIALVIGVIPSAQLLQGTSSAVTTKF